MTTSPNPQPNLVPATNPSDLTPALRQQLIDCWIVVSNTGGAAGFPFPPVDSHDVAPVADELIAPCTLTACGCCLPSPTTTPRCWAGSPWPAPPARSGPPAKR
jgi:hypothetical protein